MAVHMNRFDTLGSSLGGAGRYALGAEVVLLVLADLPALALESFDDNLRHQSIFGAIQDFPRLPTTFCGADYSAAADRLVVDPRYVSLEPSLAASVIVACVVISSMCHWFPSCGG